MSKGTPDPRATALAKRKRPRQSPALHTAVKNPVKVAAKLKFKKPRPAPTAKNAVKKVTPAFMATVKLKKPSQSPAIKTRS